MKENSKLSKVYIVNIPMYTMHVLEGSFPFFIKYYNYFKV